jgi:hypothetical protein
MTYFYTDLKARKTVCSECPFRVKNKCEKTGLNINQVIYETCPEDKWPPLTILKRKSIKKPTDRYKKKKSLFKQVSSFTKSFYKWAVNGFGVTERKLLKQRLTVCYTCPAWDKEAFKGTGRCRECGCSTWAKLRMPTEKCPLNKWGPVEK